MKRIGKTSALLAVSATAGLLLAACGTTGGNTTAGSGSSNSTCGNYEIAYLGALTGPNGALGQNMLGGINLALADYNAQHADCKVTVKSFDSQGDPDQASKLASSIVSDSKVL